MYLRLLWISKNNCVDLTLKNTTPLVNAEGSEEPDSSVTQQVTCQTRLHEPPFGDACMLVQVLKSFVRVVPTAYNLTLICQLP